MAKRLLAGVLERLCLPPLGVGNRSGEVGKLLRTQSPEALRRFGLQLRAQRRDGVVSHAGGG